jgi:predicted DNA-binding protein
MSTTSVRLKPEAEACLAIAASKTGKPRNALINESIIGWLHGGDEQALDRAAMIRKRRKEFAQVKPFDEREAVMQGRRW